MVFASLRRSRRVSPCFVEVYKRYLNCLVMGIDGNDTERADSPLRKKSKHLEASTDDADTMGNSASATLPRISTHLKALGPDYTGTNLKKISFDKKFISWSVDYPDYKPVDYTAPSVEKGPVWADPDIRSSNKKLKFNEMDGDINRVSFEGKYEVANCLPRNPIGRTGMKGRGLLGKWGPNHAADPIVTRWKRDTNGRIVQKAGKNILEFVSIERVDLGQWAIPGGMVDGGEEVSLTLKREFGEEALNSIEATAEEKKVMQANIDRLFKSGKTVYKGYVDDPRNTDNAWMETVAVNFHDKDGGLAKFPLTAGDDARSVKWLSIDTKLSLYASHLDFIRQTCLIHDAYFEE